MLLIEHEVYQDERGAFFEGWNERALAQAGIAVRFVQDNVSLSRRFVLRGLHYQLPHAQGKLVRVLAGEIFDVLVDLRRSSPTFARSVHVTLSAAARRSLWVPEGLAHGFLALTDDTQVQYKVTDYWDRERRANPRLGRCDAGDRLAAAGRRYTDPVRQGPPRPGARGAETFP